jgi:hypothetical protein
MTSTITPATLTVTVTETLTLNGNDRGSTNTLSVASVVDVDTRIVTATTTEQIIATFSTADAAGQYNKDKVRYMRFTNKDDTNHCFLVLRNTGNTSANEIALLLDTGHTFIIPVDEAGGTDATWQSNTSALTVTSGMVLEDLVDITVISNTADVDIEILVASVA